MPAIRLWRGVCSKDVVMWGRFVPTNLKRGGEEMAVKRVVSTEFWTDGKVVDMFSPEDKYFMLYLLTNPHSSQLGIYKLNPKIAAFELGYSQEAVLVLLERFERKYDLIRYSRDTQEVAIKKYLKHSIVKGGKPVLDLLNKELSQVKDRRLIEYVFGELASDNTLNLTVIELINSYKEKDNENGNDNDNDNEESWYESSTNRIVNAQEANFVNEVIDEYNRICKSLPEVKTKTDKRAKAVKARWKENGKTIEFFTGYFHRIEASDFLSGRSGKNWKANFDWVMNPTNMAKVLEGNYDNQIGTSTNKKVVVKNDVASAAAKVMEMLQWKEQGI